jgi:endo-1,4-beta-mannosidase
MQSADVPRLPSSEGLDWVVNEARVYGVRLILTLTNGDQGYGGMSQYVKWAKGETVLDFYTDESIKARAPSAVTLWVPVCDM